MRIAYDGIDLDVQLDENLISVFCIENRKLFAEMTHNLWLQSVGEVGLWNVSDKEKSLNLAKNTILVINPFDMDCNDKKLLKILYQEIEDDVKGNLWTEYAEYKSRVINFFDVVIGRHPYEIEYNIEPSFTDILKAYDVRMIAEGDTLLEKAISYVKFWHRLGNINVFIFVNLKSYLDDVELSQFYEMVKYEKIYLILLESLYIDKNCNECVKIIDKDLCVIEC